MCVCRCAAAYVLLAEEEAATITEAERLFKQALRSGEASHTHTHLSSTHTRKTMTMLDPDIHFQSRRITVLFSV